MSLLDAAKAGDLTRVGELLKGGRDVLQQKTDNCGGNSALHLAALSGHVAVLELLIEAGADLNAENSMGWTPLISAAYYGRAECARSLLHAGADAHARSGKDKKKGKDALGWAVHKKKPECARILRAWLDDERKKEAKAAAAAKHAVGSKRKRDDDGDEVMAPAEREEGGKGGRKGGGKKKAKR